MEKMTKTIKELEIFGNTGNGESETYLRKKDVNKIIDEAFIDSGARKIDFKEELKARING